MAGKREVVPMKEGETKIIRKVTQSRLGDVIKEVVVVEEHKCANGKITITTTTTTTTKKASDAVEVPAIKPEPLITAQVTTTPEAVSAEANTQSATVTETVASTTQTTATSTQETPTSTATVTESTTEATTTTTGTPTATTTVTETITSDTSVVSPPVAATPVVTTTVTETITSDTAVVSPPVAATPVVTTTVTETITSDTAVVSPPVAATPVVTTTVTETITSDTAVVSPPVAATPVVTTTVTETITSDTAVVSPPVAATPVAATPVVTTTITETITSNATTVPPPPPAPAAPVVTTTVTETITSAASATETTAETTEETTEETPKEPEKEQPPYFEISQSRGKKRALIIGINYLNGGGQLSGCINDALNIKKFLMNFYGFRETDIVLLTDDSEDPFRMPTNHNIRKAMGEMCRDSQLNDSFFFHFSGHGGNVDDYNGDEVDGKDETICPSDYQCEGQIIDDDMYDLMVRPLCAGSRLTAVFDSCHSGTALDLPYVYSSEGDIKSKSLIRQAGEGLLGISTNHKGGAMNLISSFMSLGQEMIKTRQIETHNRELNTSPADVIMFSGCDDHEYSSDANVSNEATGAMSYALIRALSENPDQTYQELLKNVRKMTVLKYNQTPQMSSSHPIDLNKKFVC